MKKIVLNEIFTEMNLEEIRNLQGLLTKFCETTNKSKADTKMMRALFMSGKYNSITDFLKKEKITKDNRLYKALFYKTYDIETYLDLKEKFNIDDYDFIEILREMGNRNNEIC